MGSTKPRPAADATTNASIWNGRARCRAPMPAATRAPTAMMPSANVVVISSATPSTAATTSQTIQASMAAPQENVPRGVLAPQSRWRGHNARALPSRLVRAARGATVMARPQSAEVRHRRRRELPVWPRLRARAGLHSVGGECRTLATTPSTGLVMRSGLPRVHRAGSVQEVPGESSGQRTWPGHGGSGRGRRASGRVPGRRVPGGGRVPRRPWLPGYSNGRPRPADMPPGPPRTRPERNVPPRSGFPPRPPRQGPRDHGAFNRPWSRPEDAMPGVGRPRPRPGPAGFRPRPQGGSRPRPSGAEGIFSPGGGFAPGGGFSPGGGFAPGGGRVPGGPAAPRGPRPDGFYGPGPGGPDPAGTAPGQPGWPGPGYGPGRPGQRQPYGPGGPAPGYSAPGQPGPGQYGPGPAEPAGPAGPERFGPGPAGQGPYGPGPGPYGTDGQPHPGGDPYAHS